MTHFQFLDSDFGRCSNHVPKSMDMHGVLILKVNREGSARATRKTGQGTALRQVYCYHSVPHIIKRAKEQFGVDLSEPLGRGRDRHS